MDVSGFLELEEKLALISKITFMFPALPTTDELTHFHLRMPLSLERLIELSIGPRGLAG